MLFRPSFIATLGVIMLLIIPAARADEAPITGSVKAIDTVNRTITVEAAARGRVRTVVIDVKPETKIIRFARGAEGKGFSEQAATLEDLKPGWMVSVKTHHQGDREVADILRVVHEK